MKGMDHREPSLELDALSWVEVAAHLARDPRLIVPVGTIEQHGAHLPLGTNVLIARRIAIDLSEQFAVLRAPTLSYGVNVKTEQSYSGSASLQKKTLHRALNDLLNGWEANGVAEFIFITAHRYEPHLEALATLVPNSARVRVRLVEIWDAEIGDILEAQPGPLHAGEAETSLMLYLYPELVRMDRARDFELSPKDYRRYLHGRVTLPPGSTGVVGRPTAATAAKGERIYHRIIDLVRTAIFITTGGPESDSL